MTTPTEFALHQIPKRCMYCGQDFTGPSFKPLDPGESFKPGPCDSCVAEIDKRYGELIGRAQGSSLISKDDARAAAEDEVLDLMADARATSERQRGRDRYGEEAE